MSYYYKYTFTSPESIYSLVKEEFKSYFDTGAVDDLLFPTYLDKCLKKLGRSSYIISEDVIEVEKLVKELEQIKDVLYSKFNINIHIYDTTNTIYIPVSEFNKFKILI